MKKTILIVILAALCGLTTNAQSQKARVKTTGQPQPYGSSKSRHGNKGKDTGNQHANRASQPSSTKDTSGSRNR